MSFVARDTELYTLHYLAAVLPGVVYGIFQQDICLSRLALTCGWFGGRCYSCSGCCCSC
jgi:hypothetical protein